MRVLALNQGCLSGLQVSQTLLADWLHKFCQDVALVLFAYYTLIIRLIRPLNRSSNFCRFKVALWTEVVLHLLSYIVLTEGLLHKFQRRRVVMDVRDLFMSESIFNLVLLIVLRCGRIQILRQLCLLQNRCLVFITDATFCLGIVLLGFTAD